MDLGSRFVGYKEVKWISVKACFQNCISSTIFRMYWKMSDKCKSLGYNQGKGWTGCPPPVAGIFILNKIKPLNAIKIKTI